eukprot:CAMPEP_0184490150 /NCGR_PEP_ID=MMETSP0113_2-20130426/17204_1 /TAXON_ID=91329 /ORGANISM="Norrisiella sphaerica, Strain BC52" /LENGTH=362 /DNA_ID=CAMNT_0026873909 /DNA_START=521 /DNA_END=1606 /DNA_ORIENTATION=-
MTLLVISSIFMIAGMVTVAVTNKNRLMGTFLFPECATIIFGVGYSLTRLAAIRTILIHRQKKLKGEIENRRVQFRRSLEVKGVSFEKERKDGKSTDVTAVELPVKKGNSGHEAVDFSRTHPSRPYRSLHSEKLSRIKVHTHPVLQLNKCGDSAKVPFQTEQIKSNTKACAQEERAKSGSREEEKTESGILCEGILVEKEPKSQPEFTERENEQVTDHGATKNRNSEFSLSNHCTNGGSVAAPHSDGATSHAKPNSKPEIKEEIKDANAINHLGKRFNRSTVDLTTDLFQKNKTYVRHLEYVIFFGTLACIGGVVATFTEGLISIQTDTKVSTLYELGTGEIRYSFFSLIFGNYFYLFYARTW